MNRSFAIVARRLRKRFPLSSARIFRIWLGFGQQLAGFEALKNVSLEVEKGEMLGVLGANGAGKSTLLRTLGGVYPPDEGYVRMHGSLAGLFELGGIGNTHMTGREYALRYMQMYGVPLQAREAMLADIADFSELGPYFDGKIRSYSAGMAARLYFATATAIRHDIYLIDEILSVGDEHFQVKSWARIRERLSSGVSGVLVTHDWSAVIKLCRRACILERGAITREGPADQTVAAYLQLPVPQSAEARIVAEMQYRAKSEAPLDLTFTVELAEDIPVEFSASIEYLLLGMGWEIVLLTEPTRIADRAGCYRVRLQAPHTPLKAGSYMLNLFLTSTDATGVRRTLHALSWTYGNGLTLEVEGPAREDLAPFPIQWRQEARA